MSKMPLHVTSEGEEIARLKHKIVELNNIVERTKELCGAILGVEYDFEDISAMASSLCEDIATTKSEGKDQMPDTAKCQDEYSKLSTNDLLDVTTSLLRYIDAIPSEVELPTMLEVDRDWVDFVVSSFKDMGHQENQILASKEDTQGRFLSKYDLGEIVSLKIDKSELKTLSSVLAVIFSKKETSYYCRRTDGIVFHAEEDELCIRGLDYND